MRDQKYIPAAIRDNDGTKLTYLNVFWCDDKLLILDPGGAKSVEPIKTEYFEDRYSWENRWHKGVVARNRVEDTRQPGDYGLRALTEGV